MNIEGRAVHLQRAQNTALDAMVVHHADLPLGLAILRAAGYENLQYIPRHAAMVVGTLILNQESRDRIPYLHELVNRLPEWWQLRSGSFQPNTLVAVQDVNGEYIRHGLYQAQLAVGRSIANMPRMSLNDEPVRLEILNRYHALDREFAKAEQVVQQNRTLVLAERR
jgi:hypothetical protein